ncbi:MAG: hypothetical protein KDA93_15850 [Planctomycetaceae bacterium]|nr:hypothetical protein [Planctomycetaceae bacterium]
MTEKSKGWKTETIVFLIGATILWVAFPSFLIYSLTFALRLGDFALWLGVEEMGWFHRKLVLALSLACFLGVFILLQSGLRRGIKWAGRVR